MMFKLVLSIALVSFLSGAIGQSTNDTSGRTKFQEWCAQETTPQEEKMFSCMQENESDEVKAVMATCSAKLGTVMPRTAKEKKDQRCDTAYKNKMADFRVCFVKESKAKNVDFRSVHGKAQEACRPAQE